MKVAVVLLEYKSRCSREMSDLLYQEDCLRNIVKEQTFDTLSVNIFFPPQIKVDSVCKCVSYWYIHIWEILVESGKFTTSCLIIPNFTGKVQNPVFEKFKPIEETFIDHESDDIILTGLNLELLSSVYEKLKSVRKQSGTSTRVMYLAESTLLSTGDFYEGVYLQNKYRSNMTYLDSIANETSDDIAVQSSLASGGTFDRMHIGHFILLTNALLCSFNDLVIAVTSMELLSKKANFQLIASLEDRRSSVLTFLSRILRNMSACSSYVNSSWVSGTGKYEPNTSFSFGVDSNYFVHTPALFDAFGPAITDSEINGIIVSSETALGALKANEIRNSRNFNELKIIVVNRLSPNSLSSTFLRGKVN